MFKQRHKIIPAAYLILQKETSVLFMLRANTGYMDGFYGLPSGHVEAKESLKEALQREALEEIGITFNEKEATLVQVLDRPNANDAERVDFFFMVKNWNGEVKNCETNKCAELRWIDVNKLSDFPVAEYIKKVFTQINQKVLYSTEDLG